MTRSTDSPEGRALTRLLHLSDVHLAPVGTDPDVGDYKEHAVPAGERQNRIALLTDALLALGRRLREPLDAVVVSGDVTLHGGAEGFGLLPALLERLGPALPADPARVVVVPGNHDVVRDTPPSSPERYAHFLKLREHGYTTPLIDGIDVDETGRRLSDHDPVLRLGNEALVVALNSANYSGMLEPWPAGLDTAVSDAVAAGHLPAALAAQLVALRRRDAARISPGHLRAVRAILQGQAPAPGPLQPARLAVLHHQLLPVTPTEEYKPFESLSNLGEVRAFLLAAGCDAVLHGHKHAERVFTDEVADLFAPTGEPGRPRRILVSSCGTVGGGSAHGAEVAKLITLRATGGRARRVHFESVPGLAGGGELPEQLIGSWHDIQRPPDDRSRVVHGRTTSDVQARLRQMFDDTPDLRVADLFCVVEDPTGARELPDGYPEGDTDGDEKAADWFRDTVQWWQDPAVAEDKPFTHGQRVRSYGASRRDQLKGAADLLAADPTSSRAVVVLLDPRTDLPEDPASQFPSFTSVQFHLEGQRLHATATFRKQEMRFWWAVNVAEIAVMQAEVLDRLKGRSASYLAGRITTLASQAVGALSRPSVAVPRIDRLAWQPGGTLRIWLMCNAVYHDDAPGRDASLAELRALVRDWRPPRVAGPDGVAVPDRGLRLLLEGLTALKDQFGTPYQDPRAGLLRNLDRVRGHASTYRSAARIDAKAAFEQYRASVVPAVDDVLLDLDAVQAGTGSPT